MRVWWRLKKLGIRIESLTNEMEAEINQVGHLSCRAFAWMIFLHFTLILDWELRSFMSSDSAFMLNPNYAQLLIEFQRNGQKFEIEPRTSNSSQYIYCTMFFLLFNSLKNSRFVCKSRSFSTSSSSHIALFRWFWYDERRESESHFIFSVKGSVA